MTRTQEIATRRTTEPQVPVQAQQREPEYTLVPPAEIYEDADGISVVLDMPGVAKEHLSVTTDRNGLVVEGDAEIAMPEGMEAIYADARSTHYRRSFALTGELDTDRIEASLKDGVLSIRVPKLAELKPRRIEIQTA